MKKIIKKIVFVLIIVSLVLATGVVIKKGKFEKLEGYMYSFATEITGAATDCNATSSNATSGNATSSDVTSSNATECATSSNATNGNATSSNATECATSSNVTNGNATSSNAQTTETINVTNIQNNINTQTNIQTNTQTNTNTEQVEEVNEIIEEKEYTIPTSENAKVKNEVSFLESHKMYIMIIGVSVLAIIIVSVIVIVDKKAIEKRKAKVNNEKN